MTLSVTVLGSSGMYGTPERACSGYLVRSDDAQVLLDAGAGVWRNLLQHGDWTGLAGVILSHRHPDHVTDVFQLFHARRYGAPEPLATIPLWAPVETIERLTGFSKELDEAFDLRTVAAGDRVAVAGMDVSFFEMAHPPETVGCRLVKDAITVAYSSDTGPSARFDALAGGADVFICEATFQDSDPEWEGHLSASQAAEIASHSGAKRLVLTHLPPGRDARRSLDEARRAADGIEVELAADGMKIEVHT